MGKVLESVKAVRIELERAAAAHRTVTARPTDPIKDGGAGYIPFFRRIIAEEFAKGFKLMSGKSGGAPSDTNNSAFKSGGM